MHDYLEDRDMSTIVQPGKHFSTTPFDNTTILSLHHILFQKVQKSPISSPFEYTKGSCGIANSSTGLTHSLGSSQVIQPPERHRRQYFEKTTRISFPSRRCKGVPAGHLSGHDTISPFRNGNARQVTSRREHKEYSACTPYHVIHNTKVLFFGSPSRSSLASSSVSFCRKKKNGEV
jgi:hypothetical protein